MVTANNRHYAMKAKGGLDEFQVQKAIQGMNNQQIIGWLTRHHKEVTPKKFRMGLMVALDEHQLKDISRDDLGKFLPPKEIERLDRSVYFIISDKQRLEKDMGAIRNIERAETTTRVVRDVTAPVKEAAKFIPGPGAIITVADASANIAIKKMEGKELNGWDAVGFIPYTKFKGGGVALKGAPGALGLLRTGATSVATFSPVTGMGFIKGGASLAKQTFRKAGQLSMASGVYEKTVVAAGTVGDAYTGRKPDETAKPHAAEQKPENKNQRKVKSHAGSPSRSIAGGKRISHLENQKSGNLLNARPETYQGLKAKGIRLDFNKDINDKSSKVNIAKDGTIELSVPKDLNPQWVKYHENVMGKMTDFVNQGVKADEALQAARAATVAPQ